MTCRFLLNVKLTLLLVLLGQQNMGYKVPSVLIELFNDQGFKLSIPDEVGMQCVFVISQVDESCPSLMDYITESSNGNWTSIQRIGLQNNDKLQISLLVQYNDHIYEKSETRVILNARFLTTQQSNTDPKITNRSNESECHLYLPSEQRPFKRCKSTNSITSSSSTRQGTCQGELIFEDNFSEAQLNTSVWKYDIRQRMYYEEEELVAFDDSSQVSYVREGHLHIVPTVASEVTEGDYELGDRCTAIDNRQLECNISKGSFFKIKPPVYSAQLHTRESFSFKYGKIVVRAKLPKGDWLFPYMMLQPVSTHAETHNANQLRIAYARGNAYLFSSHQEDISGHRLYGGIIVWHEGRAVQILKHRLNTNHYGDDFHKYTMIWKRDKLKLLVDDEIYGEIYDGVPFFNEKCFIIFGVTVGGFLNFNDSILMNDVKPYKNQQPRAALSFWQHRDTWASTWGKNSAMIIDYVRVYAG